MAAKKATKTKPVKSVVKPAKPEAVKTEAVKTEASKAPKQIDIDGEEAEVRAGSHPIFHDLERQDALRKTASRKDPDIDLLRSLLADADERLATLGSLASQMMDTVGEKAAKTIEDLPDAVAHIKDGFDTTVDALNEEIEGLKAEVKSSQAARLRAEKEKEIAFGSAKSARDEADRMNRELSSALEDQSVVFAKEGEARRGVDAMKQHCETLQQQHNVDMSLVEERLHLAEQRANELSEVEELATAFAVLVGAGLMSGVLDQEEVRVQLGDGLGVVTSALAMLESV